jgi:hypothetical protein
VLHLRSITTVRRHAEELIQQRLAPAEPRNDGRQTPFRGHPVFVAQHATATCCRTCLERWHGIPAGRALDDAEQGYVVEAICRWIVGQYAHPPSAAVTGSSERRNLQIGGKKRRGSKRWEQASASLNRGGFIESSLND